jgi:hypothetical protein
MGDVKTMFGTKELLIKYLRNSSVGDADHDFASRASQVGGTTFKEVYNNKKFKYIGSPYDTIDVGIDDEFTLLSKIFPFKNDERTDNIVSFRKNILKYGDDNKTTLGAGIIHDISGVNFKRYTDDPYPYKVKVLQVATKAKEQAADKTDKYTWHAPSKTIYDFLNPRALDEVAFTIDAVNVKFYEGLVNDNIPEGETQKIIKYLLPREGINDAAGKVEIKSKEGSFIKVEEVTDKADYNVMYPRTDITRVNQLSELECFFSNYNLSLSPVKSDTRLIPSTTLSIYDSGLVRQVQVLKNSKEDSHPNAVASLALQIKKIVTYLTPQPGNLQQKMEYFTALQQKRSGDWLQTLFCLQGNRFNLKDTTRPILCTVDKICVAYSLAMGIDVCMTSIGAHGDYWLVLIYKDIPVKPLTIQEVYIKERDAFINNLPDDYKVNGDINISNHNTLKRKYNDDWNATKNELLSKFNTACEKYKGRVSKSGIETNIKIILHAATTLCVFRTIVPRVLEPDDVKYAGDGDEANLKKLRDIRYNYTNIKAAIDSQINKSVGSTYLDKATLAITKYFIRLKEKAGKLTLASKKRGELIEKLNIFGSLFSSANGGINGVGIFSFLNQSLDDSEKGKLKTALEKFKTNPVYSSMITSDISKYGVFLNTLEFLVTTPSASVPDIRTSELLDSINEIHKIKEPAEAAAEAPAAEAPAAEAPAAEAPAAEAPAAEAPAAEAPGAEAAAAPAAPETEAAEEDLAAVKAEQRTEEEEAAVEAAARAANQELPEATLPWKKVVNKRSSDAVLQATDYGPALSILRNKVDLESSDKAALTRIMVGYNNANTHPNTQQGGGLSQLKYRHNPLTSFYFLFRELGWRLSEPDRDDYNDCIRLSQLLIACITVTEELISKNIVIAYLFLHDLERYFLYFDAIKQYSYCEHYFIKDIMSVVRDTYLARPMEVDEKYHILNPEILQKDEITTISYEKQINNNLEMMNRIVELVKKFEYAMGILDKPTQAVNTTVSTTMNNRRNTRTNKPKSIFNSLKVSTSLKNMMVHGGSRRPNRKTKSKRRNNRKTKKRKNV